MNEDRYNVNPALYTIGMICLLGCLILFIFSLYILPRLLWDLSYDVPDFIISWQVLLTQEKDWTLVEANWFIWSVFMVPSIILGVLSYWISNKLDEDLPDLLEKEIKLADEEEEVLKKNDSSSSSLLVLTLLTFIAIVILIVWLI